MGSGGKGGANTSYYMQQAADVQKQLVDIAQNLWNITKPVQQATAAQALETMRAGPLGMTASIAPLVARAVESSRMAASKAQAQAEEDLARYGLTGTPYGQQVLQGMRQAAELQLAQLPTQMAYEDYYKRLGAFLPLAVGQAPVALSGMGHAGSQAQQLANTAAQLEAQRQATEAKLFGNIFGTAVAIPTLFRKP